MSRSEDLEDVHRLVVGATCPTRVLRVPSVPEAASQPLVVDDLSAFREVVPEPVTTWYSVPFPPVSADEMAVSRCSTRHEIGSLVTAAARRMEQS